MRRSKRQTSTSSRSNIAKGIFCVKRMSFDTQWLSSGLLPVVDNRALTTDGDEDADFGRNALCGSRDVVTMDVKTDVRGINCDRIQVKEYAFNTKDGTIPQYMRLEIKDGRRKPWRHELEEQNVRPY